MTLQQALYDVNPWAQLRERDRIILALKARCARLQACVMAHENAIQSVAEYHWMLERDVFRK
jgi:hypothetical protein